LEWNRSGYKVYLNWEDINYIQFVE